MSFTVQVKFEDVSGTIMSLGPIKRFIVGYNLN